MTTTAWCEQLATCCSRAHLMTVIHKSRPIEAGKGPLHAEQRGQAATSMFFLPCGLPFLLHLPVLLHCPSKLLQPHLQPHNTQSNASSKGGTLSRKQPCESGAAASSSAVHAGPHSADAAGASNKLNKLSTSSDLPATITACSSNQYTTRH